MKKCNNEAINLFLTILEPLRNAQKVAFGLYHEDFISSFILSTASLTVDIDTIFARPNGKSK